MLRKYISFQLEVLAARWGAAASDVVGEAGDLRLREWRVLAALVEKAPQTPAQVGTMAALDKAGVSRAVDALQKRKLVVAEPDPADARRLLLKPTSEGKTLARRVGNALRKREEEMLAGLRETDQQLLHELVNNSVATAPKGLMFEEQAA